MNRIYRMRHVLVVLFLMAGMAAPRVSIAQSGAFARMGFGARGMAMSNALVADVTGSASPYYNPALAPYTSGQNLEASAALLSLDRELQFLQFATPLRPNAGVALGVIHAGVSGIDGRDNSGYHTQDYSTDEYGLFLAFGTRIGKRMTGGVGLQVFHADYLDELSPANTIGVDVGLTYRVTDNLNLGLTVDDLLARYSWDTSELYGNAGKSTTDRWPVRLRLGGTYRLLEGKLLLAGEYESRVQTMDHRTYDAGVSVGEPTEVTNTEKLLLQSSRLRLGGDWKPIDILSIRAGVDQIGAEQIFPSAGFGVSQDIGELNVHVDYAFVMEPYDAGSRHLISLRIYL